MGGWNNRSSSSAPPPSALQTVPRGAPESHLGQCMHTRAVEAADWLLMAMRRVMITMKILANTP